MILAGAAALAGYLALYDHELSNSQVSISAAAIKRHDPGAFEHDSIYGDSSDAKLWFFHAPAYQGMLELVLNPTGYRDLLLPYRVGVVVQTLLMLCGMYALLFWQTRSWSVSVFTAVMSARLIDALGGAVWGAGSLASVTPAGLCLAVWPLVVLAFARYSRPEPNTSPMAQWRVILVFIVVGLLGNLHLVTAMNMTLVLLTAYVVRHRLSWRCLPVALVAAAAALIAALPYVWHCWHHFGPPVWMTAGQSAPPAEKMLEAIRVGELTVFYPGLLKSLLDWRVLAGVLVLGIPAVAVLVKIERYITQNVRLWLGLIVGSAFVSLGFHGLSQFVGSLLGTAPPVIDFVQASVLLMLPLYVLLGQAVANLFRLLRTHRTLLRWALAALLAAWMIPADNLRVARWRLAELSTSFLSEEDKPNYVLRHREQEDRRRELEAIADFAADKPGSMYVTDHGEFRVLARRPVVAWSNDVRYLYYLAPWRLEEWLDRYGLQEWRLGERVDPARLEKWRGDKRPENCRLREELLSQAARTTDGQALADFVMDLRKEPSLANVSQWYVLIRAQTAPAQPGPLEPVESGAWGRHYRLYKVRAPQNELKTPR
jgi:hypothetical protein